MTTGTWFVLCDHKRTIAVADLEARVAKLRDVVVHRSGDTLDVDVHDDLTGRNASISVSLSTESHVPIEAADIAKRAHRPALAKLDARYELLWDLRLSDEVSNRLLEIAEILQKACDGVVYDANRGRFV